MYDTFITFDQLRGLLPEDWIISHRVGLGFVLRKGNRVVKVEKKFIVMAKDREEFTSILDLLDITTGRDLF